MSKGPPTGRALGAVVAGAATISAAPILVKVLLVQGMGPTDAAVWRVLLGRLVLLVLARVWTGVLAPPRHVLGVAALAGLAFAADLWVWHRSIAYAGAAMATILGNTQVFWVAGIGWAFFGERPPRRVLVAVVVAFAGVVLLTGVGSDVSMETSYLQGIAYGLATGLAYGAYVLLLRNAGRRWTGRELNPLARTALILAWALVIGGAILAVSAGVEGQLDLPPNAAAWAATIALALAVQIGGWMFISSGLPHLPAARAAVVLLLQPTLATLWGALFFDEIFGPLQLFGGALTLVGIFLSSTGARAR